MSKNVVIGGIKTTKHEHVGGVIAYGVYNLSEKNLDKLYMALCNKYYNVDRHVIANIEYTRFNGYIRCHD